MKWFGRKSARDGVRPALARGGSITSLGEWPRSYEAQVREGYCQNPVAQRAVKLVSEGVGSAPLKASDPALAALARARSGGQVLIETVAAQLLLHGNAYVQILCDSAGQVRELFALRPERVTVEADAGGWPVAYRYRVGEHVSRLAAEDAGGRPAVAHIKAFNPVDDHYGLGCLGAAAGAVAIHNAATRWNKALLDNAARPSGALVYDVSDGGVLSPDQFARIKNELEAAFAGAANAGRPMLLEGGLKWQAMSMTPADMDFMGLKAAAAREIALAFGVPPMLMGLPGDTAFANYREANRALWRLAILPVAETILAGLAQALTGWFPDAALAVDLDRVTALAEDRERLWRQVSAADFLSDAEKRAMVGLLHGDGAAVELVDMGAGEDHGRGRRDIAAADTAPRTLTLAYYEPGRDYQAGVQRAMRPGAGVREARMELAAAIDAAGAKTIAEAALMRLDVERERRTVALPWRALAVRPGERVTIAGAPGMWRVERWRLENMVVLLECVAVTPGAPIAEASGGRVLPAPDLATGETRVHAFELPPLGTLATAPRLAIAAAGTGPGWRSAALLVSTDDGASWSPGGATALPAVLGHVVAAPGMAPSHLGDRVNMLVVELANGAMLLHDADTAALAAGANLAMVGEELLQFAHAAPLGARQWRLSGLWRGRRGTEGAIGGQMAGDRFVLIEAAALATLDLPMQVVGTSVRVLAQGVGDEDAAEAAAAMTGISIVPPAPVHLRIDDLPDGSAAIRWMRRSRIGWDWIDGVDAPLGEESERYQVTILRAEGPQVVEIFEPRIALSAGERAAATGIVVRQIGAHGLSRPAMLELA